MKAQRQSQLVQLIDEGLVDSQQSAVALLAEKGIKATQATVSRDLDEIGAVKVRENGKVKYANVSNSSHYGASLVQVLRDYVVDKNVSANMIVLRTPPGHASVVAAAIDRTNLDGVLGVVAGDDTLFICCDEALGGAGVLSILDKIAQSVGADSSKG